MLSLQGHLKIGENEMNLLFDTHGCYDATGEDGSQPSAWKEEVCSSPSKNLAVPIDSGHIGRVATCNKTIPG